MADVRPVLEAARGIVEYGSHVNLPGTFTVCAYCAKDPAGGHEFWCLWLRLARALDEYDG